MKWGLWNTILAEWLLAATVFTSEHKINSYICLESCWKHARRSFHLRLIAESDKAGLHTHENTHKKNMLGTLKSTRREIRFFYFTISFAVSLGHWQSQRPTNFVRFPVHNPPPEKTQARAAHLWWSHLFCHVDLHDLPARAFTFTPPETAKERQPWASGRTCSGATEGQVNGDVSPSLSVT